MHQMLQTTSREAPEGSCLNLSSRDHIEVASYSLSVMITEAHAMISRDQQISADCMPGLALLSMCKLKHKNNGICAEQLLLLATTGATCSLNLKSFTQAA